MSQIFKNRITLYAFAVLAGFFCSFQTAWASAINSENVVDLVNYSRVKEGLNALAENAKLNQAALEKAQDMIQNNYFAHTSPQQVTPWFWFEKNQYEYQYAGENLAINFKNAEEEHRAWMKSPDHKRNILNPKYQEIGVAVAKGTIDNRMTTVTVQLFGTPLEPAVILGDAKEKDSLDLLNREVEEGPWGELAFADNPEESLPILKEETGSGIPAQPKFKLGPNSGFEFWEGVAVLLVLASVGINPLLFGWFFLRKRRPGYQIAYPVKVAVIK